MFIDLRFHAQQDQIYLKINGSGEEDWSFSVTFSNSFPEGKCSTLYLAGACLLGAPKHFPDSLLDKKS